MSKLKLGLMTTEEIAEWFGIKKKTYTNQTAAYLKKLKPYAEFERVRGGVEIKKIYFEEYIKNYKFADAQYLNKEIERCIAEQDGLASIAGVARKARKEYPELQLLSERQVEKRFSAVANVHYGDYSLFSRGITGTREREWAIKIDDYNHYRALSPEEYELLAELASSMYSKDGDKVLRKKKLEAQLKKKEIDVDTYFEKIEEQELDNFPQVLSEFKCKTGHQVVLASKYEILAWREDGNYSEFFEN